MLSLCLIVKPTKEEARLLNRCLSYVADHVDEICITQAGKKPNKEVSKVIKKYGGEESFFKWVNDFSKARNYNFSQASGKYILWLDADDVLKNAPKLPSLINRMESDKIDAIVMNYLYDFDDNGECTVKHLKTRIVRKDSVIWEGAVHEDFKALRDLNSQHCKEIEVLHLTDEERAGNAAERNLEIARSEMEKKPADPRSLWLMANALMGLNRTEEATSYYKRFIKESNSDDEKYLACLRLSELTGKDSYALQALGLRPTYPNAYFRMGELKYRDNKLEEARDFIEMGLQLPVPEHSIIVYNPRDYDYNPLMMLMKIHYDMGNTQKAVYIINKLAEFYPKDKRIAGIKKELDKELEMFFRADQIYKEAQGKSKPEIRKLLESLSEELQAHPKICLLRNQVFQKKKSSGKDLVIFCGYTEKAWNPDTANKDGVGGSEEAVIHLAKGLKKLGWNVTVYNNCGKYAGTFDGVDYKQFWRFNSRDKQDAVILWRQVRPVEYDINADKIFVDLHDVTPEGEFTPERLKKIDKIFVKTKAHRNLFPNIPDEKFAIIPNGIDPGQFKQKVKKNPYLIVNTSSPDRHLDATLDVFEKLIEKDPSNPWKLAWYYGWGVYDIVHASNKEMMDWKKSQLKRFEALKKQGRAEGGEMISHSKIAKKYLEAGIFLYPTQFFEIHCISAVKGQLAGCKMVTSDFAALAETNAQPKIHTDGEKNGPTFGDPQPDKYVDMILNGEYQDTSKWAEETYNWDNIVNKWNEHIS